MNIWAKRLGSVMLAGTLLTGVSAFSNVSGTAEVFAAETVAQKGVTVIGKGELSVKPDIVYLSIGAESSAATAQSAQRHNAQKMEKVMNVLKTTWKIDDKDIKTEQFSVQPNYTYTEKDGQQVKSYTARHTLQVTLRDLSKVGELLDDVSEAGANSIGNARFSVENRDAFEAQVLEKAMANAALKAQAIAKASQRQLGLVVSVVEGQVQTYGFEYAQQEMSMNSAAADKAVTSVEPGEIKLSTQLQVQYELK
ncbi:SIMPL domain-containing protein [Paenibacillus lemnae]|uniref:SIMPL domain-containing protein n=1 Tax=Paenibacillus lemnae TaxID=1330551 RepID=A0A848MAS7_PAELE|nr:SIMPL domain-containing protein [Paenibacillus lemnae]NMO97172.1 SIMPL domain-containing protein [Paenibacillus lemnae]